MAKLPSATWSIDNWNGKTVAKLRHRVAALKQSLIYEYVPKRIAYKSRAALVSQDEHTSLEFVVVVVMILVLPRGRIAAIETSSAQQRPEGRPTIGNFSSTTD